MADFKVLAYLQDILDAINDMQSCCGALSFATFPNSKPTSNAFSPNTRINLTTKTVNPTPDLCLR